MRAFIADPEQAPYAPISEVQIGTYWGFPEKSPWPPTDAPYVVRDIQSGWVRFGRSEFDDHRQPIEEFVRILEPRQKPEQSPAP